MSKLSSDIARAGQEAPIHDRNTEVNALRLNKTKAKLQAGKAVFGCFMPFPLPIVIEALGETGFDYIYMDLEHGLMSGESIQQMIMAAEIAGLTPFVRVPFGRSDTILSVLEQGAQGIIVPHIHTKIQAENIVALVKYGPEGKRGMWSASRAAGFGAIPLSQYVAEANKETMVSCIVEDTEGYNNLSEILTVPGVDAIHIGYQDLSQSLGYAGQYDHPVVKEAIDRIIQMTRGASKFVGYGRAPDKQEDVAKFYSFNFKKGVRLFLINPIGIMRNALKEWLDSAKASCRQPAG